MLNLQPAELLLPLRPDGALDVHSVFATIQGEGPLAGSPAVFVRLAGCNLQCPLCDTEYSQYRVPLDPAGLAAAVAQERDAARSAARLVVLTGGEPFRQDVGPALAALVAAGFSVQVETNGTLAPRGRLPNDVLVVCSPKTPKVAPGLRPYVSALKYVVTDGAVDPADGLPLGVLGLPHRVARPWPGFPRECVYVQPADEQDPARNRANRDEAVRSCVRFGYRYCHQLHKELELP